MNSCCSPGGRAGQGERVPNKTQLMSLGAAPAPAAGCAAPRHAEVQLPGGLFAMGDPFDEGYPNDGETPVHAVELSAFSIDVKAVSNQDFAAFIDATGHRTESELYGTSAVFHLAVQADPADILGHAAGTPWWLNVRGADWAHPAGPKSSWRHIPGHPVTQVSHSDALAYCAWAGRALPTEAQWEYAARGGLVQARYPWGNELHGSGSDGDPVHRCNIWQGTFPTENSCDDGHLTTAPVDSFSPNGYGLFQTSGNVWEWCADWFLPKYYKSCLARGTVVDPPGPTIGRGRVMRGGSYLCHDSYCNRYRLAARSANSPESASGNLGFRTVAAPA
ncbi:formylglycine-generating enzyme family protein [Specibacter sp. NPDC057265]|uniref:formylglycine-generating enzyme family protein n=1 Tax=Specibacter sp. NPDC057265 TaxID=3346075 RepID=UPI00362E7825